MPDTHESYRTLKAFLEAGFDDEELRRLAFAAFCGGEIHNSISGAGASRRELAFDIVMLVSQHYGEPPTSLWSYLYAERPHRRQEIARIHRAFGGGPPSATDDDSEHGPRSLVMVPRTVCLPDDPFIVVCPEQAETLEREYSREWLGVRTSPVAEQFPGGGDLQALITAVYRFHIEPRLGYASHVALAASFHHPTEPQ